MLPHLQQLIVLSLSVLAVAKFAHMNGGYRFANQRPGTNATHRGVDFFEVYTPVIESHYSEVKWDPHFIPLDPDFVKKYDGKLINIVGLESDIVRKVDGKDVPVPAWEQYNHHYNNNVLGKGAKMVKTEIPAFQTMGCAENHEGFRGYKLVSTAGKVNPGPYTNKFLPTGNGAEHRFTFKYFPPGYGALIESPTSASIMAMVIDTKNRDGKSPSVPTRHGAVPSSSNVGPDAMYSGLMECPCTDRYPKHITSFATQSNGVCSHALSAPGACFSAAAELGLQPIKANLTKSDVTFPGGCSVTPVTGGFEVVFNSAASRVPCGSHHHGLSRMLGFVESLVDVKVDLQPEKLAPAQSIVGTWSYVVGSYGGVLYSYDVEISMAGDFVEYVATCICTSPSCKKWATQRGHVTGDTLSMFPQIPGKISVDRNTITFSNGVVWQRAADGNVTIEITGPADVWFGVGFGSGSASSGESTGLTMAGTPWAIVVVDGGKVEERKLGNHEPGTLLPPSISVQSQTVDAGRRTLTLSRRMRAGTFNFSTATNSIAFINAVGTSPTFGHHREKASDALYLVEAAAPTCVCFDGDAQGTIGGDAWGAQRCAPRPLGQLLDDPEWASNDRVNPTCLLKSYKGGLRCCKANSILLDKNQTVPAEIDTYQVKFRYYFEEVKDASSVTDLYWTFWWTEYNNNEHDVPACKAGEDCVYTISSNFTVGQMPGFDPKLGAKGTTFIHVEGHCHIGCLKMELWIMDDPAKPKLLCRTKVTYGARDAVHDEMGYILGNEPCIFGAEEDGFEPPVVLHASTKLMSIKYQNNTVARYGDMALWEIEGAFVKDGLANFFV